MSEIRAARHSRATVHRGRVRNRDGALVAACGTVVKRPMTFPLLGADCVACFPRLGL
jgi:hypothetical protein